MLTGNRIKLLVALFFISAMLMWGSGIDESTTGDEPVKLVHYVFPAGNVTDSPEVFAEINKILKERINVEVDYIDIPGKEYGQKIQIIVNSGEAYDVCFTSNWRNNYHQNVAKGAFADLTDLLPQHAPNLNKGLAKYWDAARINDRIYAVFNEQIFARSRMNNLPGDLSDAAGIDVVAYSKRAQARESVYSIDYEIRQKAIGVASEDSTFTEFGLLVPLDYYQVDTPIALAVPGAVRYDDKNLTVFNQFDSDIFREALQYNQKLIKEGLIKNLDKVETTDGYRNMRAQGKVITPIADGGTFKPGGQQEEAKRWQYEYYQQPMTIPTLTTNGIIATMLAASSTSKNVDKVVQYFEQVNTPEIYMLFHYGIEGTHYNVTADGFLDQFEGTNYTRGVAWSMGSAFLPPPLVGQPKDVWEQTRELNSSAVKSPLIGFAFDPTDVQAEIGQCRSVYGEYVQSLIQGKRPVEDYQEMLDKFKAAGADTIIAELQKQIDAWK